MRKYELIFNDCLDAMKNIPDESVNLVLTDPPYNIGVETKKQGKGFVNKWDKIDNYIPWCVDWLLECQRVLRPNGVLYFWHNDIETIAELMQAIKSQTDFTFRSFCIWDKGASYRAQSWHQRDPQGRSALRSWFNICEYCLHFFKGTIGKGTGLDRINSNPECYRPLKEWYAAEKSRLGLTNRDIERKYTEATGRKPYMLRHYFCDSQFEIPTRDVWDDVYKPLGFCYPSSGRQSYEELRQSYEELRQSYEELRNYHQCDDMHCNVWHIPQIPTNNRLHTCQKPVEILERLIRVSCPPDGTVLDLFMGSGSTGVAALNMGRRFIGIENDPKYFETAKVRIQDADKKCDFLRTMSGEE